VAASVENVEQVEARNESLTDPLSCNARRNWQR